MKLFYDKDGKIKVWKVEYCPWVGKKELLDTTAPIKRAYISAPDGDKAVEILKENLHLPRIDVFGDPACELMTQEEYDNG